MPKTEVSLTKEWGEKKTSAINTNKIRTNNKKKEKRLKWKKKD